MKEAYYFSHDSNARHDPKITVMRGVYGSEGYGWYWMLVEMMRESEGYKLDMQSKYAFNAFALQLQGDSKRIEDFVHDCINEFDLFVSDKKYFWSASLLRRMDIREQKSEARRKAARARWDKEKQGSDDEDEDAKGMQMHSNADANAMQGKESKLNESKLNESKEDIEPIVDSDECDLSFQEFWKAYPTKGSNKKMSLQKWTTLWKKKKIVLQEVLDGVNRYVSYQNHNGYNICAAQVFLNQERWKDEWVIEEGQKNGGSAGVSKHQGDSGSRYGGSNRKITGLDQASSVREHSAEELAGLI